MSLIGNYTWGRTIDNAASIDLLNYSLNKGLSTFHMAHRFSLNGVWEVPVGRGRRVGAQMQVSAMLVLRTGNPCTIGILGDNLNTGGGYTQVPHRISEPTLPRSERTRGRFFDTNAFTRPALYEIGNAGRNVLIGPGARNLDGSISKQFRLDETKHFQFRAELGQSRRDPRHRRIRHNHFQRQPSASDATRIEVPLLTSGGHPNAILKSGPSGGYMTARCGVLT